MWCAVGVHQVVRRGVWGCRAWCAAARWGNGGVEHNARYRTVPIRLASGGRTGGRGFSSHREIKREGGVPKAPLSNSTPILGSTLASQILKTVFREPTEKILVRTHLKSHSELGKYALTYALTYA